MRTRKKVKVGEKNVESRKKVNDVEEEDDMTSEREDLSENESVVSSGEEVVFDKWVHTFSLYIKKATLFKSYVHGYDFSRINTYLRILTAGITRVKPHKFDLI